MQRLRRIRVRLRDHSGRPWDTRRLQSRCPCVCNPKALVKWTKVLAEVQRNTKGSQEIAS
jgi:hypothetical protein